MSAKKRRRRPVSHTQAPQPVARIVDKRGRPIPEWRWRTFPVLMALSTGLVVGYFLGYIGGPSTRGAGFIIYVLVLGLFSLCLAHLSQRQVGDRLMRRRARARGLKLEDPESRPPAR